MSTGTGLCWDERFAWFNAGEGMPSGPFFQPWPATDSPQSKERIREIIVASGLHDDLTAIPARIATESELLSYHCEDYVQRVRLLSERGGGDAGDEGFIGAGCYDIARLAAGSCIDAMSAVVDGHVRNAYALVRPCGHHASRDFGRGFSLFANIPVAILNARDDGLIQRVAVVDWDVHHGNGTQEAFYQDPGVLTVSIHQDGLFPENSGLVTERGEGEGFGYNLNIPLPAGSGHGAYVSTFERIVEPALRAYKPDMVVVASGLDANARDPLSSMLCHSQTFGEMTRRLLAVASDVCNGRLLMCHEGGYAADYVPYCALAILESMSGVDTRVIDPVLDRYKRLPGQELLAHQARAIDNAEALLGEIADGGN